MFINSAKKKKIRSKLTRRVLKLKCSFTNAIKFFGLGGYFIIEARVARLGVSAQRGGFDFNFLRFKIGSGGLSKCYHLIGSFETKGRSAYSHPMSNPIVCATTPT